MKTLISSILLTFSIGVYSQSESDYYQIKTVPIPKEVILEVGGLAFNPKGELGVSTRRGEIWTIANPSSANPKYNLFARGMHENLGLAYYKGNYFTAQRSELTKITDSNGDNFADKFETIASWELSGNYHEYSFGPVVLPNGDMLVTLNLAWHGGGKSFKKWRGWLVKITQDGELIPIATGLRSPAGFGVNEEGDIFYAENQGDWVGSGRVTHLESGDFAGHPQGLNWSQEPESPLRLKKEDINDSFGYSLYEYSKYIEAIKPPSVWFPHTIMGVSTSDISLIPDDFGPFTGQMLVGDQGHSTIMRMFQEKVNGVYQGACFPFVKGFSSGVLRLEWGNSRELYVGMTSRGWNSTGPDPYGLQRLVWTGRTPFEIKAIRAQPDGFELEFTQPISAAMAAKMENFKVQDFTYLYHQTYGSPVHDLQHRMIHQTELSADGHSVRVYLDKLRKGYIYSFELPDITNKSGIKLLHPKGFYTLNEIPEGSKQVFEGMNHANMPSVQAVNTVSTKRITQKPADWKLEEIVNIEMSTVPGLKFDKNLIEVKANDKVKVHFVNPDDMLHNFVVTMPGKVDEVVNEALALGLNGQSMNYVPNSPNVLYHTAILQPETNESIYFKAPATPGDYSFVCTYPGHGQIMRGILRVR
ncbi:MAG: auracyanin family protein [Cyclobacteriaceae bacterium]